MSRVKVWALGLNGRKMAAKSGFCKEYNKVTFLCDWTDRHEIPAKTLIGVLYRTLIEQHVHLFIFNVQHFALRG